jgi:hypothetical protein
MRYWQVLKERYLKECGDLICGELGIMGLRKLAYSIS